MAAPDGWNQKRPAGAGRAKPVASEGRRDLFQVIAASAVAPNSVAPTVAATSDTSANAISSFMAFILSFEQTCSIDREMGHGCS